MTPQYKPGPLARSVLIVSLLAGVAIVTGPASAEAQMRRNGTVYTSPPRGYVTAESRWGNGTVSGPVRQGKFGPEVRLPGGTWIHCVRSCSETLRRETVDFWQSHGNHAPDPGPGYFQWDFWF